MTLLNCPLCGRDNYHNPRGGDIARHPGYPHKNSLLALHLYDDHWGRHVYPKISCLCDETHKDMNYFYVLGHHLCVEVGLENLKYHLLMCRIANL